MKLKKPIKVRFLKEAETYFLAQSEKFRKVTNRSSIE